MTMMATAAIATYNAVLGVSVGGGGCEGEGLTGGAVVGAGVVGGAEVRGNEGDGAAVTPTWVSPYEA